MKLMIITRAENIAAFLHDKKRHCIIDKYFIK